MTVYHTGNTIRLYCNFRRNDEEELLVNPEEVKIVFMNRRYQELEVVTLDSATNTTEEGAWFYDYTLPNEEMTIIYDWVAIYQNSENFKREMINTVFE